MDFKIDITSVVLETERLILRAFTEADMDDFYAYASVPGVGEMAGWPHHESVETSKKIIKTFIDDKNVFALFHKAHQKVIGSLGIHRSWVDEVEKYRNLNAKEIGFVLSKEYWGQGLTCEAVEATAAYGFGSLGLDAITCCHFVENIQSRRVIEKCGFNFVKDDVYYSKQLDRHFDEKKYIRLRIPVSAANCRG